MEEINPAIRNFVDENFYKISRLRKSGFKWHDIASFAVKGNFLPPAPNLHEDMRIAFCRLIIKKKREETLGD